MNNGKSEKMCKWLEKEGDMGFKIDRRGFLKKSTGVILGAGIPLHNGWYSWIGMESKSRVVEIIHPGAVSEDREVNQTFVRAMLKQGVKNVTGLENPWVGLFNPTDRIGLKINTLGRPVLFTHHELINALIEELLEIGVKANNIIVWDRWEEHMVRSRFELNTSRQGVRYFGTEGSGIHRDLTDPEVVYKSDFDNPERRDKDTGTVSLFSQIFTQYCDKIVNLAILKDHGYAGVTLCLKNLAYGITTNNSRFHGKKHIGPFISDVCKHPWIRKKVVLHVIDGLEGCYDNGPVPGTLDVLFTPKTLWLGTDPVALDTVGYRVIQDKRREEGLPSLEATGRPTDHIALAAKKGVGVNDLNRIIVETRILSE